MSAKVPREVRSVSRPPGTGILGRREREEAAILTGGCPRHASRRLGRGTHHNSEPDQTTRLNERRESTNLPPRREDGALTQPAVSPAPLPPPPRHRSGPDGRVREPSVRRAARALDRHAELAVRLLHRRVVAQLLQHGRHPALVRCARRAVRSPRRRARTSTSRSAGAQGGGASDSFISSHRCSLSNLCVDGRARLKENETERWIDARGVRERVAVEAGLADERAQPQRRSTRPRRVELDERDQLVHHARKLSSSLAVHKAWCSCWWLISAPVFYHHLDLALASHNVFCGNKVE